ncbi:MAG: UDP-glucose 4-epimerase GalE [Pseudomonadota bacterium]
MAQRVVVAGGAGYIGSHVCVALLDAGRDVLVIDDFSNGSPIALDRIREVTGRDFETVAADLASQADRARIEDAARAFAADGAVLLAGLKAVGESVEEPLRYYETNFGAAAGLLHAMAAADAKALVFSSSATVYGDLNASPVSETAKIGAVNPYGRTKQFIEEILRDHARATPGFGVVNLRYFNPVGAHESGRLGEDPNGVPNNLFPYIAQTAVGRRDKLHVFGNDYPTPDGTGVRDYIHVVDLARGHVNALDYLARTPADTADDRVVDVNLGVGAGASVLEAIAAFKRASNRDVPFEVVARRPGDVAEIYADPARAKALLGWTAEKTLDEMCADHWAWQRDNPDGYGDASD